MFKKYTYAYRFRDEGWHHFESCFPPNPQNAQSIAEDAMENYAVRNVDYKISGEEISVAIRSHEYSFFTNVESCPIFSATPKIKQQRGTQCIKSHE